MSIRKDGRDDTNSLYSSADYLSNNSQESIQSETIRIFKCIRRREAALSLTVDVTERWLEGEFKNNDNELNEELTSAVTSLRLASRDTWSAINRWENSKKVFLWQGSSYISKMDTDTLFLSSLNLKPLFSIFPESVLPLRFSQVTPSMAWDEPSQQKAADHVEVIDSKKSKKSNKHKSQKKQPHSAKMASTQKPADEKVILSNNTIILSNNNSISSTAKEAAEHSRKRLDSLLSEEQSITSNSNRGITASEAAKKADHQLQRLLREEENEIIMRSDIISKMDSGKKQTTGDKTKPSNDKIRMFPGLSAFGCIYGPQYNTYWDIIQKVSLHTENHKGALDQIYSPQTTNPITSFGSKKRLASILLSLLNGKVERRDVIPSIPKVELLVPIEEMNESRKIIINSNTVDQTDCDKHPTGKQIYGHGKFDISIKRLQSFVKSAMIIHTDCVPSLFLKKLSEMLFSNDNNVLLSHILLSVPLCRITNPNEWDGVICSTENQLMELNNTLSSLRIDRNISLTKSESGLDSVDENEVSKLHSEELELLRSIRSSDASSRDRIVYLESCLSKKTSKPIVESSSWCETDDKIMSCVTAIQELENIRARLRDRTDGGWLRRTSRNINNFISLVRTSCPETFGFRSSQHATRVLRLSLLELSNKICVSQQGSFMVSGKHGKSNQISAPPSQNIIFLQTVGVFKNSKVSQEDYFRNIFHAAILQGADHVCLSLEESVPSEYFLSMVTLFKEVIKVSEKVLILWIAVGDPKPISSFLNEHIHTREIKDLNNIKDISSFDQSCIFVHSRSSKFLSIELANVGFHPAIHIPSNPQGIILGLSGGYWEKGKSFRYSYEEGIASTSTLLLSHYGVNGFRNQVNRYRQAIRDNKIIDIENKGDDHENEKTFSEDEKSVGPVTCSPSRTPSLQSPHQDNNNNNTNSDINDEPDSLEFITSTSNTARLDASTLAAKARQELEKLLAEDRVAEAGKLQQQEKIKRTEEEVRERTGRSQCVHKKRRKTMRSPAGRMLPPATTDINEPVWLLNKQPEEVVAVTPDPGDDCNSPQRLLYQYFRLTEEHIEFETDNRSEIELERRVSLAGIVRLMRISRKTKIQNLVIPAAVCAGLCLSMCVYIPRVIPPAGIGQIALPSEQLNSHRDTEMCNRSNIKHNESITRLSLGLSSMSSRRLKVSTSATKQILRQTSTTQAVVEVEIKQRHQLLQHEADIFKENNKLFISSLSEVKRKPTEQQSHIVNRRPPPPRKSKKLVSKYPYSTMIVGGIIESATRKHKLCKQEGDERVLIEEEEIDERIEDAEYVECPFATVRRLYSIQSSLSNSISEKEIPPDYYKSKSTHISISAGYYVPTSSSFESLSTEVTSKIVDQAITRCSNHNPDYRCSLPEDTLSAILEQEFCYRTWIHEVECEYFCELVDTFSSKDITGKSSIGVDFTSSLYSQSVINNAIEQNNRCDLINSEISTRRDVNINEFTSSESTTRKVISSKETSDRNNVEEDISSEIDEVILQNITLQEDTRRTEITTTEASDRSDTESVIAVEAPIPTLFSQSTLNSAIEGNCRSEINTSESAERIQFGHQDVTIRENTRRTEITTTEASDRSDTESVIAVEAPIPTLFSQSTLNSAIEGNCRSEINTSESAERIQFGHQDVTIRENAQRAEITTTEASDRSDTESIIAVEAPMPTLFSQSTLNSAIEGNCRSEINTSESAERIQFGHQEVTIRENTRRTEITTTEASDRSDTESVIAVEAPIPTLFSQSTLNSAIEGNCRSEINTNESAERIQFGHQDVTIRENAQRAEITTTEASDRSDTESIIAVEAPIPTLFSQSTLNRAAEGFDRHEIHVTESTARLQFAQRPSTTSDRVDPTDFQNNITSLCQAAELVRNSTELNEKTNRNQLRLSAIRNLKIHIAQEIVRCGLTTGSYSSAETVSSIVNRSTSKSERSEIIDRESLQLSETTLRSEVKLREMASSRASVIKELVSNGFDESAVVGQEPIFRNAMISEEKISREELSTMRIYDDCIGDSESHMPVPPPGKSTASLVRTSSTTNTSLRHVVSDEETRRSSIRSCERSNRTVVKLEEQRGTRFASSKSVVGKWRTQYHNVVRNMKSYQTDPDTAATNIQKIWRGVRSRLSVFRLRLEYEAIESTYNQVERSVHSSHDVALATLAPSLLKYVSQKV